MAGKLVKVAAYHEAAHAAARIYFGLGATDVEINADGTGMSHGTGESMFNPVYLVVTLAGPFAEARVARLSRNAVLFFGGGKDDWADLQQHPLYAMFDQIAEKETNRFLRRAWPDIERVASALIDLRNKLPASEVARLPASEVARLVGEKRLYTSIHDFARRWGIATNLESKSHAC